MKAIITCFILALGLVAGAQTQKIRKCIILDGVLQNIDAEYDSKTGETSFMHKGVKVNFDEFCRKSKDYAAAAKWYINDERIRVNAKNYMKYGLPRMLSADDVVKSGNYKGVGVYTEKGATNPPEVIYIPASGGCAFQPYQIIKK